MKDTVASKSSSALIDNETEKDVLYIEEFWGGKNKKAIR